MILSINIGRRKIKFELPFIFLCLSVLLLPINIEVAGPLRINDIFLTLALISVAHKIKFSRQVFHVIMALIIILSISSALGLWAYGIKNLQNIGFIYKFLVPLFPLLIISSITMTPERIRLLHRLLLWVFIALTAWVYLFLVLRLSGMLYGSLRPSFPFSNDPYLTDAHLYSCFLAMGLVMYNFYWKKYFRHGAIFSFFINVISLPAIVLTGSKTGIVVVIFAQVVSLIVDYRNIFQVKKTSFVVGVLLIGVFTYLVISVSFDTTILRLAERALDIQGGGDSSASRIRKLLLSFDQSSGTFLIFGVGLVSNFVTWYDGLIGSTNGFMGLAGLMLLAYVVVQLLRVNYYEAKRNQKQQYFIPFAIVTISYLLANLITEYYLVTRGVLPVAIFLVLLHYLIKQPAEIELEKASNHHS
ncbi:hypothetical protein RT717_24705 [Imperialibacter roseus]|uniref:Uncharacterized protein n=1 Tax=Imperialibacter roseus TaxID=1324217 RepID=A0ABZ0IP80_9BACT|nr:hypothetical protein [Imperialibacter roseus]WOK06279.1 hypothetical protein RT717_24705 [Imperialibacter roseus]